jgi:hypothetical protein
MASNTASLAVRHEIVTAMAPVSNRALLTGNNNNIGNTGNMLMTDR